MTEPTNEPPQESSTQPPAESAAPPSRSGRRTAVIAAVSVLVAGVLGVGAWGAARLIGSGPQPADVLPASSVAYLAVDLDPSAGQKIEAFRTLRKFPGLKKELGLGDEDDVRRYVVDEIVTRGDCAGIDFDDDVKPWIGDRVGVAAVDLDGTPVPAVALQVDGDLDKAADVLTRLAECGGSDRAGYAETDGYLVFSDSIEHAEAIVKAGRTAPLADAAGYTRWTEELGDRGVVNFFVAKEAADLLVDEIGGDATVQSTLEDFRGLAGTVRFDDGGAEVALAAGGVKQLAGEARIGEAITSLPADTAAALGIAVPDDYAEQLVDQLSAVDPSSVESMIAEAERQTGLSIPEDVATLLGKAVVLTLGGEAPADLAAVSGPRDLPAAVTVTGDPDAVHGALEKLDQHTGFGPSTLGLVEKQDADRLTLATQQGYADQLLSGDGERLGDAEAFRTVVPEAERASGVLFLQLEEPWRKALTSLLAGSPDDKEVAENLLPLKAFGASSWLDGDVTHGLLKLTTR